MTFDQKFQQFEYNRQNWRREENQNGRYPDYLLSAGRRKGMDIMPSAANDPPWTRSSA
jgi:hypothetical protein